MALTFLKRTPGNPDDIAAATGKAWLGLSAILDGDEVLTAGIAPKPAPPNASWATLAPAVWSATEGYASVGSLVTNGGQLFSSLAAITAPGASGTTYTELGRWNDTPSDYRTANDADYTNFTGVAWCANRNPLNNVADPFPLNSATTYRLRYVPGGSATQAAAQVIGTPTQAHIDNSPGGGIACYRFGTAADMTAAFGNPESNPNSPARFNGGTWILERQNVASAVQADWRATPIAAAGTARYNHTGRHLAVSVSPNSGVFPTNLTGTWRLKQVGAFVGNPPPPNASYTTLAPTAHSPSAAYAIGALTTSGGKLWRAIAVVSGTQTRTWANGSTSNTGEASYNSGVFGGTIFFSLTPATGAALTAAEINGVQGTLSLSGANELSRSGTITASLFSSGTGDSIQVRINGGMNGTFGSATTTGETWTLVSPATNNPAPENDATHWTEVPTTAWSEAAAVAQNAVVTHNNGYFQANTNIGVPTQAREVDGALTIVNPASGGVMDIRVGSAANMQTAFGNVAITSGGNFELRKLANAAPADDAMNWSQVVVTPWDARRSYLANAIVSNGDPVGYFRANANINVAYNGTTARKLKSQLTDDDRIFSDDEHAAAPVGWRARNATPTPAPPTYTAIINWSVGGSNSIDNADYYTDNQTEGITGGTLFANYNPAATTLTTSNGELVSTQITALTTGTPAPVYRLRLVSNQGGANGLPAGKSGVVVGALSVASLFPFGSTTRFAFRVGTAAQMREAFGDPTYNLYAGGGEWVLERRN